ncbi:MAG: DUF4931 domain-containing protein [Planctomycetota bacterium JB042]
MSSELRIDPLTGHRVLVSAGRAQRPNEFRHWKPTPAPASSCPFCWGNERETPPELYAERPDGSAPNGPGWRLRVVPNRFPALAADAALRTPPPPEHEAWPGVGHHEVVLETERHDASLADLAPERLVAVLRVYRDRVRELATREGVRHVVVFRNGGPRSGASLTHPHTQIAAAESVPPEVAEELARLVRHRDGTGRCLQCDLVLAEVEDGTRVLARGDGFVAYLPYAGRFPAQVRVTPETHPGAFVDLWERELEGLGARLGEVLKRLREGFDDPSFNVVLHGAVVPPPEGGHHWRVDVLPRLAQVGGFELATGVFINGVPPEEAARRLRG